MMERINRENVKSLSPKDNVTEVANGFIKPYKFLAAHPTNPNYFFAYATGDAKRFYIPENGCEEFYIGYDSEALGKIAIKQLKQSIEDVKEIYIQNK